MSVLTDEHVRAIAADPQTPRNFQRMARELLALRDLRVAHRMASSCPVIKLCKECKARIDKAIAAVDKIEGAR